MDNKLRKRNPQLSPASCILHPASWIVDPASCIVYPASCIMKHALLVLIALCSFGCHAQSDLKKEVTATLKEQIISKASWALKQHPVTVTASISPRSAGGKHDFYSEGD